MHKVCGYHLSPSNYSMETLSAAMKCCECLLVRPRSGNLTHNRDPRVGKLKMSNFPWVAPSPILGQIIDRFLNFGYEKLGDWYELINFVKNCNVRQNSFGTLTFAAARPFSAICLTTLPKWRCCFPSNKEVLFKEGFKGFGYLWLAFSLVFYNNETLVFKCLWQCFACSIALNK